jgi:hypothetical protein
LKLSFYNGTLRYAKTSGDWSVKRIRQVQTVFGWALVIGIIFSIIGAGGAFGQLAGGILAIALVVGGILIIIGMKRPGEILLPVLAAAFAIGFVPSLISGLVQNIWRTLSWPALFLIGLAVIVIALIVSRERQ